MTLIQHEIKNIYIGEYKEGIECDFTQSDCGFTYYGQVGGTSNGRDNNGLFNYTSSSNFSAATWSIPSNIYSQGEIKKIVIEGNGTKTTMGAGVSTAIDSYPLLRSRNGYINDGSDGTTTDTTISQPAGDYIFTIDLENGTAVDSRQPSTSVNIKSVSNIKTAWSNGTLHFTVMCGGGPGGGYSYVSKVTFYV